MTTLINMLPSALMMTAPILIAASGGMVCERAGVVNIALEGLMAVGAMSAATVHFFLQGAGAHGALSIPIALTAAVLVGIMFSCIHAFASISMGADQVVSGTGINLLSTGITVFFCQILFRQERSAPFKMGMLPGPYGIYPTALIALCVLLAVWYVLYRRPLGFRLRACGEHPQAAASSGVDVVRIRYIAVLISGALAGLAGGCLVLTQTIQYTANTINGKGFIALAAVSLGRWLPLGILGASLLFGVSIGLAVYIVNISSLNFLPSEFFSALPYMITLFMLVLFSGKDYAPKAAGQVYEQDKR
jgi:simple sugar transport system permease protein